MGLRWDCPAEQTCSRFALAFFADCLCSTRDTISFFMGAVSIVCWLVTDLPQIVVRLQANMEHFPLACVYLWMLGDIMNLAGCAISSVALPTQFYLAVLYTGSSVVLAASQTWSSWMSCFTSLGLPADDSLLGNQRSSRSYNDLEGLHPSEPRLTIPPSTRSLPERGKRGGRPPLPVTASVPVHQYSQLMGTYAGSVPSQTDMESPRSSSSRWGRHAFSSSYSEMSPVGRGLVFSSLVIVGVTISGISPLNGVQHIMGLGKLSSGRGGMRRVLTEDDNNGGLQIFSVILGWCMMCIYMTWRSPPLISTWTRDVVIDVSTPIVILTFLGNGTYLASILVRDIDWRSLIFVFPWITDTAACLLIDSSILVLYLKQRWRYQTGDTILE